MLGAYAVLYDVAIDIAIVAVGMCVSVEIRLVELERENLQPFTVGVGGCLLSNAVDELAIAALPIGVFVDLSSLFA
jgi:hypothetical protein